MDLSELSGAVIGAAIEVHRELGPGLLESAYELALERELGLRKVSVQRQVAVPLEYKGIELGDGFRLDLLVDDAYYDRLTGDGQHTAILLSSKSEETSLESKGLRQGVFSHFLLRGLKGEADLNKDSVVTIKELFEYVSLNVKEYTEDKQTPEIKGEFDAQMPVVFKK